MSAVFYGRLNGRARYALIENGIRRDVGYAEFACAWRRLCDRPVPT